MNKYIFDKQKAKLNQWQLIDVKNEDSKINDNLYCYWLGNEYPSFSMIYDEQKNIIREKTKYEQYIWKEYELQDGEYIEDKEIKYKEKPKENNNFWFWKDFKWNFDLENFKKELENEIFYTRNNIYDSDLKYKEHIFRALSIDIENMKEKALQITLGVSKKEDEIEWRLKNDSVIKITFEDILNILNLWFERKNKFFEEFNLIYEKFLSENNVENLNQIIKYIRKKYNKQEF